MKNQSGAFISGNFRYSLFRVWDDSKKKVGFLMLNPSKADEVEDDNTIRKCVHFAKSWGYGSLEVINLFAYRATYPTELKSVEDPVGSLNDIYIKKVVDRCDQVILAWGNRGSYLKRNEEVLKMIDPDKLYVLEMSLEGHPKHPLFLSSTLKPKPYKQKVDKF
ncbi:DUF1643 domain-containing protein [Chengkuizengella axinellae]|uniref:DUF1643 domain-containing protein n=1 Tax=Chengkuizengella axinellae TaxID=3064388 RepID=A0ABT9IVA3_9BACL|nr:DUF1643 domain-containing protein [Chengkuizengella sp. 2205SS18-9]MDP5273252.1 DUF1643 domain-containing protein [Chengkuizengella sp. 2205SS18-9]